MFNNVHQRPREPRFIRAGRYMKRRRGRKGGRRRVTRIGGRGTERRNRHGMA